MGCTLASGSTQLGVVADVSRTGGGIMKTCLSGQARALVPSRRDVWRGGGTYGTAELVSDLVVARVGVSKLPYELGKCGGRRASELWWWWIFGKKT